MHVVRQAPLSHLRKSQETLEYTTYRVGMLRVFSGYTIYYIIEASLSKFHINHLTTACFIWFQRSVCMHSTYIYVIHVRCPYVHVLLQLLLPWQANRLAVLLLLL